MCWLNNSADNILIYCTYLSQKIGFDIPCKLSPKETVCMKCQSLVSEKNKKNITNLLSAEFAHTSLGRQLDLFKFKGWPHWLRWCVTDSCSGHRFNARWVWQHFCIEIDHEIFSAVILSLLQIQEGQFSVQVKECAQVPINHLED